MNFFYGTTIDENISDALSDEGVFSPNVKTSPAIVHNMENSPFKQTSSPACSKMFKFSENEQVGSGKLSDLKAKFIKNNRSVPVTKTCNEEDFNNECSKSLHPVMKKSNSQVTISIKDDIR